MPRKLLTISGDRVRWDVPSRKALAFRTDTEQKTAVTGYLLSKGNWNKVSGHDIIAKSLVLPLSNANLDWR